MAQDDQREEKIRYKLRSKRLFATGSEETGDVITSASMAKAQKSFEDNLYISDYYLDLPDGTSPLRSLTYIIQQIQEDVEDLHAEVSQSVYTEQVSEFSNITTGSFNYISSSLTPDADNIHDLGSSTKEWKDLYVDGTAHVDAINLGGTTITATGAELNYTDGVSSAIQTQLNAKVGYTVTGVMTEALTRFNDQDTTPQVNKGNKFETRNSRATSITMFDNGQTGQEITIIIGDAVTTFVHDARAILLNGARNWTPASGDTITFIFNGSVWLEKCRSDNT